MLRLLLALGSQAPDAGVTIDPVDSLPPFPSTSTTAPRRMDGSIDYARVLAPSAISDVFDQEPRRKKAVQYSNGYYTRLKIHKIMSVAMIPLFAGQFITGTKLIDHPELPDDAWQRKVHKPLAIGTGIVFTTNTVTGIINLIESNKNPEGRTRRWIHGLAMLAADAGFAYTGIVLSDKAKKDPAYRNDHRNLALTSMGLAVSSWTMMLIWN